MDRAAELANSLPRLLNQDYPNYQVLLIDHSSTDGLDSVILSNADPLLNVIRCPRPEFFNRSRAANIGVRYSDSDLLFFLDSGIAFARKSHLSEIVDAFCCGQDIDYNFFRRWRASSGFAPLKWNTDPNECRATAARQVYCECECHGLHLLVSRDIFQRIGGLNEALVDWGYEDTDLTSRLELCGYGRVPIRGLKETKHTDDLRVRFHQEKNKERSWAKNRQISDSLIETFGPILKTQRRPGAVEWVESEGVLHKGVGAPQQDWIMETAHDLYVKCAKSVTQESEHLPVVSVVLPTKNAAHLITQALDSVLTQEYPNIECIVADGGSQDSTVEILSTYGDLVTWTSEPDRGAFDAINRGWQHSTGSVLAWLNVDDSWARGAVARAVRCLEDDTEADVIYGDCLIVDEGGKILEIRRPPDWDLAYAVENCHHVIDQPAAFMRRSALEGVGWLYPAWFHDWDLWRRISLSGGNIKRVPYLLGRASVRKENTQYDPRVLVKGLVGLTERFFTLADLPPDIMALRPRAISNCYLKIIQTLRYGGRAGFPLLLNLRMRALLADPSNLKNVIRVAPGGRRAEPRSIAVIEEKALSVAKSEAQLAEELEAIEAEELSLERLRTRPLVSVVVPCRNDARFLPEALASILSQDYDNIECIVVDGGSTDETLHLLEEYGDKITWISEADNGAFDAINRGWKLSKGEILAWVNADDQWAPGAARKAVAYLERHPDVDVVYGRAGVIDEDGRILGELIPREWDLKHALLYCDHIIFQPASFMRRSIIEKVGGLTPAWCHDHDLWLRASLMGGTFAKLNQRLGMDRMRSDNLGRVAELVIPAKIGLTKRFFEQPDLPQELKILRRRSISNAYIRAVDYLRIENRKHWLMGAKLFGRAVATDPLHLPHILAGFARPFGWHAKRVSGALRSRLRLKLR